MAQLVPDGQLSFNGGQDASLPPSRLPENKYHSGVNITTSQGVIRPRYAYERKKLSFPRAGYAYQHNKSADFQSVFEAGKFQAMAPYQIGNKHYIVVVISGIIFLINQDTYDVNVLTTDTDTQLNESSARVNWSTAGRFLVLHDFPSRPVIIEGQSAHRSVAESNELPASTLGVYNQSRLFFANAGNEFSAGDPVGNELTPDAPITAEEIMLLGTPYYAEIYQAPTKYDAPISAMATLQSTDTSTGIGPLLVASKKEIFVFNITGPRDSWITRGPNGEQAQFGKSISDNAGIAGQRAFTNVNSDLFFVSQDGQMRSISMSRDEQKKWARVPMSLEVNNWVSYLDPSLVEYSNLTYFNNKIFWTVRPYRIKATRLSGKPILDVAHSGFVVLSTDNVARLGSDAAPAWEGLWTGVRPLDTCVTNERMFIMSKDYYSRNELYEVDPELNVDRTQEGHRRQIKGTIYTREHFFQDMFALKDLRTVELGVSNIEGCFEVGIDYKPSHSSNFKFLSTFKHNVPVAYYNIEDGQVPQRKSISFRDLKFGIPEDSEDGHPVTGDLYDQVKRVQFKISLTGDKWQLNEYRIQATVSKESDTEVLPDNLPVVPEKEELYSDWTYEEFGIGTPKPVSTYG